MIADLKDKSESILIVNIGIDPWYQPKTQENCYCDGVFADKDANLEMWKELKQRESGIILPQIFSNRIKSNRVSSLQLSNSKDFISPHRGAINSIEVDITEGRYLLSGASDASVALFDIQHATDYDGEVANHRSLFVVDKQHEQGHRFAISSVNWYPIDTGLFVSGSFDHYVKIWDTNTAQVVMDFKMPGKVYSTAMSSIATSHMLIAAGSADVQVRLCDIASGAFTHTLSGHRDGIMALEWSNSSEWVLISGGCDGAIRFWDIRRAGCFLVLDQSKSQLGRRPPYLESTTKKLSTAKKLNVGRSTSPKTNSHSKSTKFCIDAKLKKSSRSSVVQRAHPGLLSINNRATAHYGAVTGLKATRDGMYLLSSGSDSRLKLWDVESGCNTLVNFESMRLQTNKTLQMDTNEDSTLIFVPCMATSKAYDMSSGKLCQTFRGHYESVNCCYFNTQDQELYTGSNDRKILVWSTPNPLREESNSMVMDQDNWSD